MTSCVLVMQEWQSAAASSRLDRDVGPLLTIFGGSRRPPLSHDERQLVRDVSFLRDPIRHHAEYYLFEIEPVKLTYVHKLEY